LSVVVLALVAGAFAVSPARAGSPDEPGWLGVSLQDLNSRLRDAMEIDADVRGALVSRVVPGSPADEAGIRDGDVVVEFDGDSIRDVDDLVQAVRSREAGEKVLVVVHRDDRERGLTVVLGSREDMDLEIVRRGPVDEEVRDHLLKRKDPRRAPRAGEMSQGTDEEDEKRWTDDEGRTFRWRGKDDSIIIQLDDDGKKKMKKRLRMHAPKAFRRAVSGAFLGVRTMGLNEQLAEYFDVTQGVLVTEVVEDSPAEAAGIQAGDVILSADGRAVEKHRELRRVIHKKDPEDSLAIELKRRGTSMTLTVTLGDWKDFSDLHPAPGDHQALFALPHLGELELPELEALELPPLPELELLDLESFPELELDPDGTSEIEIHMDDLDDEGKGDVRRKLRKLRQHLRSLEDRIHQRVRDRHVQRIQDKIRDRMRARGEHLRQAREHLRNQREHLRHQRKHWRHHREHLKHLKGLAHDLGGVI
jgi:hypothetical protein